MKARALAVACGAGLVLAGVGASLHAWRNAPPARAEIDGAVAAVPEDALTLLFTADTHSYLETFTPVGWDLSVGGAARRKTLVDRVRAERGPDRVLLVDAGDFSEGTPFFTVWKGSADVAAMNAIGYDVVTLGNHDFALGEGELARTVEGGARSVMGRDLPVEGLRAPIVSTNLDLSRAPAALRDRVLPTLVVERGGRRYGFLGITTKEAKLAAPSIGVADYAASIATGVAALRAKGVDRIVLLSHRATPGDQKDAPSLSGVDVIVSAHSHHLTIDRQQLLREGVPTPPKSIPQSPIVVKDADGHNTLIVAPGSAGVWLGRLDVRFDAEGNVPDGGWRAEPILVRGCARNGEVDAAEDCSRAVPEDAAVAGIVRAKAEVFAAWEHEVVGAMTVALGAPDRGESPLGDLVADAILAAARRSGPVDAAILGHTAIRSGVAAGPLERGTIESVLPFPDEIVTVSVTGAVLRSSIERLVARDFPALAGMTATFRGGGRREQAVLSDLAIGGAPVDPAKRYVVAVRASLTNEGRILHDAWSACQDTPDVCRQSQTTLREAFERYVAGLSPVAPPPGDRLREAR